MPPECTNIFTSGKYALIEGVDEYGNKYRIDFTRSEQTDPIPFSFNCKASELLGKIERNPNLASLNGNCAKCKCFVRVNRTKIP